MGLKEGATEGERHKKTLPEQGSSSAILMLVRRIKNGYF